MRHFYRGVRNPFSVFGLRFRADHFFFHIYVNLFTLPIFHSSSSLSPRPSAVEEEEEEEKEPKIALSQEKGERQKGIFFALSIWEREWEEEGGQFFSWGPEGVKTWFAFVGEGRRREEDVDGPFSSLFSSSPRLGSEEGRKERERRREGRYFPPSLRFSHKNSPQIFISPPGHSDTSPFGQKEAENQNIQYSTPHPPPPPKKEKKPPVC